MFDVSDGYSGLNYMHSWAKLVQLHNLSQWWGEGKLIGAFGPPAWTAASLLTWSIAVCVEI